MILTKNLRDAIAAELIEDINAGDLELTIYLGHLNGMRLGTTLDYSPLRHWAPAQSVPMMDACDG